MEKEKPSIGMSVHDFTQIEEYGMKDGVSNGYFVSEVDHRILNQYADIPIVLESFLVLLCIAGETTIEINFVSYTIKKGTLVILPQHSMLLCNGYTSPDYAEKYMSFEPDFIPVDLDLQSFYFNVRSLPCIDLPPEEYAQMIHLHGFLMEKYHQPKGAYATKINQFNLLIVMMEIAQCYERHTVSASLNKQTKIVQDVMNLMFSHYKNQRDVEFYAQKMTLSKRYLSKLVQLETGQSVAQWITSFILFESQSLLKTTSMTVVQIAQRFNYPDATSFGKFFKKQTGVSPIAYRKNGSVD